MDMSNEAEQFHNLSVEIQQLCSADSDMSEVEALTNPVRGQVSFSHLKKGTFLYSAVSSLWDCSKHFTLHPLADLFIPTLF